MLHKLRPSLTIHVPRGSLSRRAARAVRRLFCREDGGAYTLSYVMVIPVLTLLICLTVETTLMMSARLGTVYAAYSGARTACVWSTAGRQWPATEARVRRAATRSFVPFARTAGSQSSGGSEPAELSAYTDAYAAWADDAVSRKSVERKFRDAASQLTVTTSGPPATADADITVTVTYRFRFGIPGVGRLLGEQGADGEWFVPITSSVTLQNEGPRNANQDLGIGYGKFDN